MRIQKIYFPVFLLNKEMTLFCCEYFSITKKKSPLYLQTSNSKIPFLISQFENVNSQLL